MLKSLIIARWEFLERVKRKTFIISMVIMPILVLAFSLIPSHLLNNGGDYPLPIGIIDFTNKYQKDFSKELGNNYLPNGQPAFFVFNFPKISKSRNSIIRYAEEQVLSNGISGFVVIDESNDEKLNFSFRTNDMFNLNKINLIENSFYRVVVRLNATLAGVEPGKANEISSKITKMDLSYIEAESEEEIFKSFINSYIFIILLVTMILFSGGLFVRSLVLEKSNRIIEIILSSCTSKELLLGKVLGLSIFGLFQLLIWIIIGLVLHKTNTLDFSTIKNLEYQLLFFVIGYVFYSSIFVGLGSIVNADHEAQQLTGFLSLFLFLPIILAVEIIRAPNSIMALLLSYFPLTSVPIMLLRLNSTRPNLMEVISIILVLLFSLYLVILASSKLFRLGILRTGSRPSIKEIISWLKLK